ncbi:hypothetical protein GTA07_17320 [Rhodococcus hoagii]|nr:hypothetical protein [Prescottella equi]
MRPHRILLYLGTVAASTTDRDRVMAGGRFVIDSAAGLLDTTAGDRRTTGRRRRAVGGQLRPRHESRSCSRAGARNSQDY